MVQVLVAAPRDVSEVLLAEDESINFETVETGPAVTERLASKPLPEVMLLHVDLPGLSGLTGTHLMRARLGGRPLAVLVNDASPGSAQRLLAAGASAVLPEAIARDAAALSSAITLLASGYQFALFAPPTPSPNAREIDILSEREMQVLEGICDGLQNKEIAHACQIQEVTVKMHVRAIIRKLSARNRTHAAMIARDLGIV